MPVTEQRVQNAIVAELGKLNYRITTLKSGNEQGVDICARHNKYARYFLIECKGDPSTDAKYPASGRDVRFLMGLGQIITRIHPSRGYYYGLAFPSSYQNLVTRRLSPGILKLLKLHLFFVTAKGGVTHFTWRDLTKIQQSDT